jgi:hypothetical protein
MDARYQPITCRIYHAWRTSFACRCEAPELDYVRMLIQDIITDTLSGIAWWKAIHVDRQA